MAALIGLVAMIILDFTFGMLWISTVPAVLPVWAIITPELPAQGTGVMNLLNNIFGWTLILLIVGTIVYGAAYAMRRDPVEYAGGVY